MATQNIEVKVKHDFPSIIKMDIYQGYVVVKDRKGKYLYSKFTGINRLNEVDARQDAVMLRQEMQYIPERVE
jgi:hypothetical protein